jgi:hypothetical protein
MLCIAFGMIRGFMYPWQILEHIIRRYGGTTTRAIAVYLSVLICATQGFCISVLQPCSNVSEVLKLVFPSALNA